MFSAKSPAIFLPPASNRIRGLAALLAMFAGFPVLAQETETLPPLKDAVAPTSFEALWAGFDPRAEPLEIETLVEWEEEGVVLRVVRFRIGVFKGTKARLAAIYGFPKSAAKGYRRLPGLVQIHGGGQYADHKACLTNAKRGYATVSIAWAGRISSPNYRVTPKEVKLFWDGKTGEPAYRLTTDWGALDGYHAPGRNQGNQFPSVKAAAWTLDSVDSPRNSGWFLAAVAARRALTFLERQPEVDPDRLGVYGHSMGGKLTVMTAAADDRVKAAAPSCGGISDRFNSSPIFRATLGDDVSLRQIDCPLAFLSPANDFHGRLGDLPKAVKEIGSREWRATCSPHHNHQDTAEYEVATQLWMDQHLKGTFQFPRTPTSTLNLMSLLGPRFIVKPDSSRRVLSVDVFYTQQGREPETPQDREDTMSRFWHHVAPENHEDLWSARLPLTTVDKPLWVYANVLYALDEPVTGAGYYYGVYTADSFNISSLLTIASAEELQAAGLQPTRKPSLLIEDFKDDWEKEWFTYKPAEWARATHKLHDETWRPPAGARLTLDVRSAEPNQLVVLIDDHAAEAYLKGDETWQTIELEPGDFHDFGGEELPDWRNLRLLKLTHAEHLRPPRGDNSQPRLVGRNWRGAPPEFRDLRWQPLHCFLDFPRPPRAADYEWTTSHMHVGVRWQPFIGRPAANAYDATRPVLARDSSYVQFWASWAALEPTEANTDYTRRPSPGLRALEEAVEVCNARGQKVEFVFFHCPAWASESGQAGGFKPKEGLFTEFVRRVATRFKGRVHAYQLSHEANNQGLMHGADVNFIIDDILLAGARTIRAVYATAPAAPVLVSTTGMSPCETCEPRQGLGAKGAKAVDRFYDLMIANDELMDLVDALNLNVSDHDTGFGNMDGKIIPSVWAQYDLVRRKLDEARLQSRSVMSSESWIVWDGSGNAHDINGDGVKNEKDACRKAAVILGRCLERGLNTINLPWSDNSSSWAMGLTRRRDYNGRVKALRPDLVVPANDDGPDIVTRKLALRGNDDSFEIHDGSGNVFTVEDYLVPAAPEHPHYHVWRWFAQIADGPDEVIRHAVAGEPDNEIVVSGDGFKGDERCRIASWNRTRQHFTVLIHADGADRSGSLTVAIPSRIRSGRHYNNDASPRDFRGEGFTDGEIYRAHIITKDINDTNGADIDPVHVLPPAAIVANETLTATVPKPGPFTAIRFVRSRTDAE